jgi:hypothetical protein
MPKPVKNQPLFKEPPKPKRPSDPIKAAQAIQAEHQGRVKGRPAAGQPIFDPEQVIREHMRKLGAKGGKVSGAKRMEMPERQRKAIAKKAAAARWGRLPSKSGKTGSETKRA